MKLINKKTKEIRPAEAREDGIYLYEEPKEYWYIEADGSIVQNHKPTYINHLLDGLKSIGNYFESEEEAKRAVDKLKAGRRLKDRGFRFKDYTRKFDGFKRVDGSVFITAELDDEGVIGMIDELALLFGDEE